MRQNKFLSFVTIAFVILISCSGLSNSNSTLNQVLDSRDSIYILFTVKALSDSDWNKFTNYSKMYDLKNEQIEFSIEKIFYNKNRTKMIAWVGKKMPNAKTNTSYSSDANANRICSTRTDTIFAMNAIIGFREDSNLIWRIFPFDNISAYCYPTRDKAINIFEDYFLKNMKDEKKWKVIQADEGRGAFELKKYEYNLDDPNFWDKCWMWDIDSVGSNNLHNFEIQTYSTTDQCFKCAVPYILPKIVYPPYIVTSYSQQY